jgi:CRISPR/Cas system-associated exonuclease Cas4 (RecB family)
MESDVQLQENIQLYVYAMALYSIKNKYPNNVGLWYLVHNQLKKVKLNMKNMDKIKSEILNLISEIEKSNFNAKPSFFACTYCDFNKICPDSKLN